MIEKEEGLASEPGKITRNFRSSSDIENFYRFVHENNLRDEAHQVMSLISGVLNKPKKKKRKSRKKVH